MHPFGERLQVRQHAVDAAIAPVPRAVAVDEVLQSRFESLGEARRPGVGMIVPDFALHEGEKRSQIPALLPARGFHGGHLEREILFDPPREGIGFFGIDRNQLAGRTCLAGHDLELTTFATAGFRRKSRLGTLPALSYSDLSVA